MILTVTLNPAIDVRYDMGNFQLDKTNRIDSIHKTAGGKGLNVTRVVHQLGEPVLATGLLGGKAGEWIESELDAARIRHDFYHVEGETRSCHAFLHEGHQTEVLEAGPTVSELEWHGFLEHFVTLLEEATLVVASGSLPKGVPTSAYRQLNELVERLGKRMILDTSGIALREGVMSKPFLIKPNETELAALEPSKSTEVALDLLADTIPWIVHSMGKDGAIGLVEGERYVVTVPSIEAINPVGSGDAMVAGIAVGLLRQYPIEQTLALGSATGTLNALEPGTGTISVQALPDLLEKIKVNQLFSPS
ncbi:1-phosphofructokinase family hexose kinase [Exiguobacterium sp. s150]|uniref:1-phosphofructokinase family hexose kinase n=1 Tax=Exiguobacterium sp. s150 TaxID=2751221 RepID=UPI001BEA484A|nr:hexose kinase [Exiguobacterium sp. s150]